MKTMLFEENQVPDAMRFHLDASAFTLPTGGADVLRIGRETEQGSERVRYYRLTGEIHPVDPAAEPVRFQVNLPVRWNERALQYCGGAFDGKIVEATDPSSGEIGTEATPLEQGYVTFGCDGGHTGDPQNCWDSRFALNRESLLNFGYQSGKKTYDAVRAIIRRFYGAEPQRIFIQGGSNGGREVLKAIQRYPGDYDGAICFFPVLNWIGKALLDNRNANMLTRHPDMWMDTATFDAFYAALIAMNDELDGEKDGILANPAAALRNKEQVLDAIPDRLTEAQKDCLRLFAADLTLPYPLANGVRTVPGYGIFTGANIQAGFGGQFGTRGRRDGEMAKFADAVIRYQIMQDEAFDPADFDAEGHREQVQRASEILDATDPALDSFFGHGGKMILVHGTADQLVSMYSTIAYYERLRERFPEDVLEESLRFYLVPGYGHGRSEAFTVGGHFLRALEAWTEGKPAPETITVTDQTPGHEPRIRQLRRYRENTVLMAP